MMLYIQSYIDPLPTCWFQFEYVQLDQVFFFLQSLKKINILRVFTYIFFSFKNLAIGENLILIGYICWHDWLFKWKLK